MTLLIDTTLDFQNVNEIINLPDPTLAQQPATKHYVDLNFQGMVAKDAVQASDASDISIAAPGAFAGFVAGTSRLLLYGQTTGSQNGIWIWNGAAAALTRSTDFATGAVEAPGTVTYDEGSATLFVMNNTGNVTVDTTASTWAKIGSATAYTATAPLSITGTVISMTTPLPIADGGTGGSTAAGARSALAATGKYAVTVGDGTDTTYVVTHNLGTTDVNVNVYDMATGNLELAQVTVTGVNTLSVVFGSAPTAAGGTIGSGTGKRVVVVG